MTPAELRAWLLAYSEWLVDEGCLLRPEPSVAAFLATRAQPEAPIICPECCARHGAHRNGCSRLLLCRHNLAPGSCAECDGGASPEMPSEPPGSDLLACVQCGARPAAVGMVCTECDGGSSGDVVSEPIPMCPFCRGTRVEARAGDSPVTPVVWWCLQCDRKVLPVPAPPPEHCAYCHSVPCECPKPMRPMPHPGVLADDLMHGYLSGPECNPPPAAPPLVDDHLCPKCGKRWTGVYSSVEGGYDCMCR